MNSCHVFGSAYPPVSIFFTMYTKSYAMPNAAQVSSLRCGIADRTMVTLAPNATELTLRLHAWSKLTPCDRWNVTTPMHGGHCERRSPRRSPPMPARTNVHGRRRREGAPILVAEHEPELHNGYLFIYFSRS